MSILKFTPERIKELKENEIFVFGSYLNDFHSWKAAAMHNFDAVWGRGVVLQGQSYAIPTMLGGVEMINPYIDVFIEFKNHSYIFLATRIDCGIAGFHDVDLVSLSKTTLPVENILFPRSFVRILEGESLNQ